MHSMARLTLDGHSSWLLDDRRIELHQNVRTVRVSSSWKRNLRLIPYGTAFFTDKRRTDPSSNRLPKLNGAREDIHCVA